MFATALLFCIVSTTPKAAPTTANLDAYQKFQEFHFEFRFEPEQSQRYRALLEKDYAAGRLVTDIDQASETVAKWTANNQLNMWSTHCNLRQADDIEFSTEQMLNNGTINGTGVAAGTRREAKDGCESSRYLLATVQAYRKPVRGDGNIYTSLFRKEIDSFYEWTAVRAAATTGKKIWDGSPESRRSVEAEVVKHWDALKSDRAKQRTFKDYLGSHLIDWLTWRICDYSLLARMSKFEQREIVDLWARQIEPIFPKLKPQFDARKEEFRLFVSKLSEQELREEFARKQMKNAQFAEFMRKRQAEGQALQQTVSQIRQSMLEFHIANLNIAENSGNSGFVWTLKN